MDETQDSSEITRPTRVRSRWRWRSVLIGSIGACLLITLASVASYAADAVFAAPWAYPVLGRPTLTGIWEGAFTTTSGTQFAIFLNLKRPVLASGTAQTGDYQGALIAGSASWCDNKGRRAVNVPIDGAVPTFSGYNGSADKLEIDLESASHPQNGLLPTMFQGKWQQDTLTLHPTFSFWDGKTFTYSSNSPDFTGKITIVLKKVGVGAFPDACALLTSAAP